jgi:hypothetical protein
MNWPVEIDWESPAGKLLVQLGDIVPANRRTPILLFGSAALQVTFAPTVLSDDADIAPDIVPYSSDAGKFGQALDRAELSSLIQKHGLGKGQRKLHIQVNAFEAFDPGSNWGRRTMATDRGNLHLTIPHPLDILIAKLHRYEEKDLEAFKKIYALTGFPSPEILLAELRSSPRLFAKRDRSLEHMPRQFPESKIRESVPKLFSEMWGMRINVNRDILQPTEQAVASSYNDHQTGHQADLADIAENRLEDLPAAQGSGNKAVSDALDVTHVPKKTLRGDAAGSKKPEEHQ